MSQPAPKVNRFGYDFRMPVLSGAEGRTSVLLLTLASSIAWADEPSCSVTLTNAGDQKISVIKIVREYTGLGLREAKDLVEAPKPKLVKEGMDCGEADALVAALVEKGASAEAKGRHGPAPAKDAKPATFDVKLESFGTSKILVIKIVRDRTGLGLADTKKLVESAPVVVKKGLGRAQADSMLKELTEAGAKATVIASP